MVGPLLGAWRCVSLLSSTVSLTPSSTPSSDLLAGYNPPYNVCRERKVRDNHAHVQRQNADEVKQKHDGDDDERARSQSHDEEIYTPRSPSVSLPPELGLRDV